jgi:hypothetical protein
MRLLEKNFLVAIRPSQADSRAHFLAVVRCCRQPKFCLISHGVV